MTSSPPPTLILGAGNPFRRDDGAGRAVVRRLAGRLPEGVEILELSGEASELLRAFEGRDTVIVVDAVQTGAPPGTIRVLNAGETPLPADLLAQSTHGFGVGQAIELARRLGRLPRRICVVAIEGENFAIGEGLSPAVDRAIDVAAGRVLETLGAGSSYS